MIDIDLQPIQDELYQIYEFGKATKVGFGGPRGGTKSHSSDVLMLMRRYKYRGTNGLFIMRVYQDMWDIHLTPLFDAYPELEKSFNKQLMILRLPYGSYVRYLSGDNLASFQQRKGRGFADVMIDQSELFSKEELEFLYTINRSVKPGITPKMLLCFNPGSVGHAYHKRVFYDKIYEANEKPEDFAYLQAKGWDNAYWAIKEMASRKGLEPKDLDEAQVKQMIDDFHLLPEKERFEIFIQTDYGRVLDGLPEHRRRAELLGDMDIFEGMFWEDFRITHHIVKGYKITSLRATIAGLDYGNVTVLEILQRDTEGTIIVAGECYLPDITNPSERANAIADYLLENEIWRLEIIYDTDMEISQLSNIGVDKTPIAIFRDVFKQRMGDKAPRMRCVNKKSLDRNKPYRVVVNDSVKEYLHINKVCVKCNLNYQNRKQTVCGKCGGRETANVSKLLISDQCRYLIKFFTEAIYGENNLVAEGDFDRSRLPKIDHPYDGFKYGFMDLYVPKKKEESSKPKWLQNLEREQIIKIQSDFMGV